MLCRSLFRVSVYTYKTMVNNTKKRGSRKEKVFGNLIINLKIEFIENDYKTLCGVQRCYILIQNWKKYKYWRRNEEKKERIFKSFYAYISTLHYNII
jgi:hypothetical protein